jgi:arabinogalactan oligomer/maltooligosaccharide transport system substrate-binding protein
MKRSFLGPLTVSMLMSLLAAACGPTPEPMPAFPVMPTLVQTVLPPGNDEAEPVEELEGDITLWHAWNGNEVACLNEVIAAFQVEHPRISFDVKYIPFNELRTAFRTEVAAGSGPTLLIGAAEWGPAFYDAGLVVDLSPMATEEFLGTFHVAALGAVEYNGALIGLPQAVNAVVLYRNRAIIADAPASLDELLAAAKLATQGDIVGADLEQGFFFSAGHLTGLGGMLMDDQGDPMFDDEKGVEWLQLLASLSEAGPTEYYSDDDLNLFKAGKAGMIIDGTWNMAGLTKAIGPANLAIDPWPTTGDGYLSGYVRTENVYLSTSATSDDQQAAWEFIEFFLSPQAQSLFARAGRIPAVASTQVSDPLMSQAIAALAGGTPLPVIPEMEAYWEPMDTALKSVLNEKADPAAALEIARDSVNSAIANVRSGQ